MRPRLARLFFVPLALFGPLALSHVIVVERGIHFKGGKVDFGVPPQKYGEYYWNSMQDFEAWRPGTEYLGFSSNGYYDNYDENVARDKRTLKAYKAARNREIAGRYGQALGVYRSILRRGLGDVAPTRRHIEILKSINGRSALGLKELLSADDLVYENSPSQLPTKFDPRLRTFVEYLRAYRLADAGKTGDAARALYVTARKDLHAPWVEECLISAARNVLDEDGKATQEEQHIADASLRLLLTRFPDSRFHSDAYGWLGRIDFLNHRTADSIRHYQQWANSSKLRWVHARAYESIALAYRQAGRQEDAAAWYLRRIEAISTDSKNNAMADFRRTVEAFDGTSSRRFLQIVSKDQGLLGSYLDYRVDRTTITPDLLKFGADAKDRAKLAPHVLARLSEAAIHLNEPVKAHELAVATLHRRPKADDRDLASFVLGTLAMRKGRIVEARKYYSVAANRKPAGYLAGGAKENLAIIAERTGHLDEALDLYDDLNYQEDFAYLADARMTPEQLAAYLRRPGARKRPVLLYTLGMRYLRIGKWSKTQHTFARLTTHQRRSLTAPPMEWGFESVRDEGGLQDPKSTLKALRHLDRAIQRAKGSEAKAQAMLNMADYYYYHRYLLLYSIPLWLGNRADSFSFSWNSEVATPADDNALARHHDEHECFAHTLKICRAIVKKYPNTKAAHHAAYRGACAAERLANMAQYLRWQDTRKNYVGQAANLMRLAAKSTEPDLAHKAKKYAKVFAEEEGATREAFSTETPPKRHWDPRW